MAFMRQTGTLIRKNFTILLRHPFTFVSIPFVLPIFLAVWFGVAQNLFRPPVTYGTGDPNAIRSLAEALEGAGNRNRVVFVNGGYENGPIDSVIDSLTTSAQAADGIEVLRRSDDSSLNIDCEPGQRAVTDCFGAVSFYSSPSEGGSSGDGSLWNYTIFLDGAIHGLNIHVDRNNNDVDKFLLPLQRAVDAAIANVTASNASDSSGPQPAELPATIDRLPFTSLTEDEYEKQVREDYQSSIINFLAVAYLTTVMFVIYHMTGFIATERESGMTQLIDAMMPIRRRWVAQLARVISYHVAFSLLYLPGWVIGSIVLRANIWSNTSIVVVLVYYVLAGLAMASAAILVSSFFQKAQLSGVTALLATVLLGILAQALTDPGTGVVAVLSLLFTPCNVVFFLITMARWERERMATNLTEVAPNSSFELPAIVFWIFLIIQIVVYPLLGILIEGRLFGTSAKGRTVLYDQPTDGAHNGPAVRLDGFSKHYPPSAFQRLMSVFGKPRETVKAVDGLTLDAPRGMILCLLGSNGSGKSTTLDSIAGTNRLTSGSITIDGTGGLGIAPQKNVLWDELTVEEHLKIFNRLKAPGQTASKQEIRDLVQAIDLSPKRKAFSKTLSGGQKRKLQLGMMLTGGSAVCCVDEVSSGLDPLSRRKIWDILLAERGRRTIILTTHFLDEADLLADHIAVLSKGTLRASGSSVELKNTLGAGYRVHVPKDTGITDAPEIEGVQKKDSFDFITYVAPSSALAAQVIRTLEARDIKGYNFSGPTIEDVFLQLAEETRDQAEAVAGDDPANHSEKTLSGAVTPPSRGHQKPGLSLMSGRRIGYVRQSMVLFRKRCTIFKTNWLPYVAAFIIPIIAAGLVTIFIRDADPSSCAPPDDNFSAGAEGLDLSDAGFGFVIGPGDKWNEGVAAQVLGPAFLGAAGGSGNNGGGSDQALDVLRQILERNTTVVDSFQEFTDAIDERRADIKPAGLWLGDDSNAPTLAYLGNRGGLINSLLGQNILDMLLSNVTVSTRYAPLEISWADQNTQSLQLFVYIALALCLYPAFFALYPSLERHRHVRGLEYSNGVRPLPLWMAYIAFDFSIVLVASAIMVAAWAAVSDIWYHIGFIYLIFILYGLASILLAYVISLVSKTQLAAFATTAMLQAGIFLVYIIAYFFSFTAAPIERVDDTLRLVHFIVSIFAPIGSVARSLLLALNLFSTACDGDVVASNPGGMLQYGGPILYLILQSIVLFGVLLWGDSGSPGSSIAGLFRKKAKEQNAAEATDEEVAKELTRVTSTQNGDDGLKVTHVTKSFGKNTAVDNVTFGIKRGEVFACLGPNGAGKSTLISLIRGDLKPSHNGGDIFIEDKSVISNLAAARGSLGVCPQHDALDQMTVREHLEFYARIRGIPEIDVNVNAVIDAVGLRAFSDRQAHALSGGNKRKLSLGIALMGNPTVVLLDEPSSGLDAAAKRIMWKTLAATVPGRSILLTTHSMEEAGALAGRAGILAKRMLALGTPENLRRRFGDALHVHLISKSAPHTSPEETERVRQWVESRFPGAEFDKTYHGQMRFAVPASEAVAMFGERHRDQQQISRSSEDVEDSAVGQLVVMLEEMKEELGIMHFSVTPTTLDQVFLTIVGNHNIQEEGYKQEEKKKDWKYWLRVLCCWPRR
ncbi:hypothetical protein VDGD_07454 [Verticillium dahliae]|nr:hypothetical protein VDGD_07454 [Verticillium dahliae]